MVSFSITATSLVEQRMESNQRDYRQPNPGGAIPPGEAAPTELNKTIQLGQQLLGFAADITDLARMEALLAVQSIPRLLMLWLIMMPVILLTWCSLTALIAWAMFSVTGQIGVGLFSFFLQQVLLLLACYLLYTKYKKRMTMPYTRKHWQNFIKEFNDESSNSVSDKKL